DEQAARERALVEGGATVEPDGPDGRVSPERAQAMAAQASAARAARSAEVIQQLRAAQPAPGEPFARAPRHVMIGGGAAVAALTSDTLFIDAVGRWHVDQSGQIAQTAGQLGPMPGLGDAHQFAGPD